MPSVALHGSHALAVKNVNTYGQNVGAVMYVDSLPSMGNAIVVPIAKLFNADVAIDVAK